MHCEDSVAVGGARQTAYQAEMSTAILWILTAPEVHFRKILVSHEVLLDERAFFCMALDQLREFVVRFGRIRGSCTAFLEVPLSLRERRLRSSDCAGVGC